MPSNKKPDTLFLDRDGVLNKKIENGYVLNIDQIEVIPGISEFICEAKNYFQRIIVITNQRCVGLGLINTEELFAINDQVNKLTGSLIDRFYICPHLAEDNCCCRKPREGMFLDAKRDYNVNFENSWMIGDSESDMIPAKNLGITTFFLSAQTSPFADKHIGSLFELKAYLERFYK